MDKLRVIVADIDGAIFRLMKPYLEEKGFEVERAVSGAALRDRTLATKPHVVLIDLVLPDLTALTYLKFLSDRGIGIGPSGEVKVFVFSTMNHPENLRKCMHAGAADFIVKPFMAVEVYSRIIFHFQTRVEDESDLAIQTFQKHEVFESLGLVEKALREALVPRSADEGLFELTRIVAELMNSVRVSVIETDIEKKKGYVLASSDNKNIKKFEVDLRKYPEVAFSAMTGKTIIIENLDYDPRLKAIKDLFKDIQFQAMVVCPVICYPQVTGVMSVRLKEGKKVPDYLVKALQMVANIAALSIARGRAESAPKTDSQAS